MKFDLGRVTVRKRDRLPHWDVQHGIYFVTFNLFDALPRVVRQRIREEAEAQAELIRRTRGELRIAEKAAIEQWVHARIGETLDETRGSCFMRDRRVARIVAEAITYFDEKRYRLLAWCVMSNHVHVVFTLAAGEQLSRVIHSWKSFTAKRANEVLGRVGEFWGDGYFDRAIRDSRELEATVDYVLANPGKAGLVDWPFVQVYGERFPPAETAGGGGRDARPPLL